MTLAETLTFRFANPRLEPLPAGPDEEAPLMLSDTLLAPEFQLALYAAAVAQARPGVQVDAAYVSINGAARTRGLREAVSRAGLDPDALLALDPAERARLREKVPPPKNLADRVWERVHAMRAGRFAIAPITCEHCDLGPVCRIVALPVEDDE